MTYEERWRLIDGLALLFCGMVGGFMLGWSVHKYYFTPKDEVKTVVDTVKVAKPVAKDSAFQGWIKVPVAALKGSTQNHDNEDARALRTPTGHEGGSNSCITGRKVSNPAPLDTVWATLPRTQKRYEDSIYEAWISGYEPRLDSIYVYRKTVMVTNIKTVTKRNAFSLGIVGGAGYGVFSRKLDVFVGIGGSIRLW